MSAPLTKAIRYVLVARIVRYVLVVSESKFMLCTRLRNDTLLDIPQTLYFKQHSSTTGQIQWQHFNGI